jgi:hypothetical protein
LPASLLAVFVHLHTDSLVNHITTGSWQNSRERTVIWGRGDCACRQRVQVKKGQTMRKSIFRLAAACVVLGSMSAAAPAFAQDEAAEEAEGPITISGGIAVVSDYRFRGVSLSDKDFAIQPTLTISHESGFYVGVWGSTIAENPGR